MAHFAEIDGDGTVLRVIVVADEHEADGEQWCADLLGGIWKRTSYNTSNGEHALGGVPFRENFAGIGMKYDARQDAFLPLGEPEPIELPEGWIPPHEQEN